MQIFPKQNPIVTCPICKKTFRLGNVNCCVLHAPGTCCHYGDIEVGSQEVQK